MAIFEEAMNRLFKNVYVCRRCKSKRKAPSLAVQAGKVGCRKCGSHQLRVVRKK